MSVKLLTEHHFEFLSLLEDAQARLSPHMSKCHIVGNHMSRLISFSLNSMSYSLVLQAFDTAGINWDYNSQYVSLTILTK